MGWMGTACVLSLVALAACSGKIDGGSVGTSSGGSSGVASGSGRGGGPTSGGGSTGSGAGGANGSGPSTGSGGATDLPTSGACFATTMSNDACVEKLAFQFCADKGYVPMAMNDTPSGCVVTCCTQGPSPPTPTPTPVPGPNACTWSAVGSGATCLSFVEIATQAQAYCEGIGGNVQSLHPANDCPSGATIAKVECCPK